MKLHLKKNDLNKGLQVVSKIAQNKNNNMNTEYGIFIKAVNNQIEIQANDYAMGIKTIIPGIIEEEGETFVANPYLIELIRKISNADITFIKKDTDSKLIITGGNLKFECATMNASDFNAVEIVDLGYTQLETNSLILKDLIDSTTFSCATDMSKAIFMGAYLDIHDTNISMVATDTHRLAIKKALLETPIETPLQVVIPSKLLAEISRQLPVDIPEIVTITAIRNYVAVRFGNVYIKTQLIEGNFPNYERVIPTDFQSEIIVDRDIFTGAVERTSVVAKDAQYNVINFTFSNQKIKLMSQHPEYGIVEDVVPCTMTGEDLTISFNGKYIIDILKHCRQDKISLKVKNNSPMLVTDQDKTDCLFVVTPMRNK